MHGQKSIKKSNIKMPTMGLVRSFGTQASQHRLRSFVKLDHHLAHQSSKLVRKMVTEESISGQTQLRNATTHHLISQASSI